MKKYKLNNLDCASCASKIENSLSKMEEVKFVSVNFANATMTIDANNIEKVKAKIKAIEPDVEVQDFENVKTLVSVNELAENKGTIIKAASALVLLVIGIVFEEKLHNTPFQLAEYAVYVTAALS